MTPNEAVSIYLHIPFCTTKCTYCAFNTFTNLETLIPEFVKALAAEVRWVGSSTERRRVKSIFFGGGTPSLLTPAQFAAIFIALRSSFDFMPDAEITLEANPNDLDRAYCSALVEIGFNRISLGMQSVIPNELKLFARRHDNDSLAKAVSAVRLGGFDNMNLDLIYGVPHQTLESWETSVRAALALQPDHLSLYGLGLEDGTPMKAWVERGRLPAPDDDLAADMYDLATDILAQHGFEQYEISNWSKPGRQSRHNLQYWYNLPYLGFGPGAHGFADGVRYAVIAPPQRYVNQMLSATEPTEYPVSPVAETATKMDRAGEIAETLIMSLRLTQEGVDRAAFKRRFDQELLDVHPGTIAKFQQYGLLEVTESRVRLTQQGRLLSNMIFRELV